MIPLLILTLALLAATIIVVIASRKSRKMPPEIQIPSITVRPDPTAAYSLAMLSTAAAVIIAILVPIVAIFHSARQPALIALLLFFILPTLAYAFLARRHYLPHETPTLKPPTRK